MGDTGRNPRSGGRGTWAHEARVREEIICERIMTPRFHGATQRTARRRAAWACARHSGRHTRTVRAFRGAHGGVRHWAQPRRQWAQGFGAQGAGARDTSRVCFSWPRVSPHDTAHHTMANDTGARTSQCLQRAYGARAVAHTTGRDTQCDLRDSERRTSAHGGGARAREIIRQRILSRVPRRDLTHRAAAHGVTIHAARCLQRAHGARAHGADNGARHGARSTRQGAQDVGARGRAREGNNSPTNFCLAFCGAT
jgi:hypothetical protein